MLENIKRWWRGETELQASPTEPKAKVIKEGTVKLKWSKAETEYLKGIADENNIHLDRSVKSLCALFKRTPQQLLNKCNREKLYIYNGEVHSVPAPDTPDPLPLPTELSKDVTFKKP